MIHDVVIIGGGISGLTALHILKKEKPDWQITLLEADSRLGGTIGTDNINGFSFDWGPNGFLDREPLTLQLVEELGLNDELERADDNVSKRFILRKGKLREVPLSPPKFLTSDIMSFSGRMRVMGEPFAKKRPEGIDESIYDFAERRIGKESADYLIQPMVAGIYGGMADRLSLKSCFPIMREMEDTYGSLIKAMIAKAKQAKKNKKAGGPGGPTGWLTSFKGGLYRLIEQFHSLYTDSIQTGANVIKIDKSEDNYAVTVENKATLHAKHIIFACPTYKASDMTRELSSELADSFSAIPYAPIAVVCTGYDKQQVKHPLDGFGFLVPVIEGKKILGSIWTSSIFNNRAPEGKVQFRTMIGGDGDHQSAQLSDDDLVSITQNDLHELLGLNGQPQQVKIYRWTFGIPQFKIGHAERVKAIETGLKKSGRLYVTGNAYYGIGLNDCVKQSYKICREIIDGAA